MGNIGLVGHNRFGTVVQSFSISLNKVPVESLIRRAHDIVLLSSSVDMLQDVSSMSLSSDEMELYAKVLRQFRIVFQSQEHMSSFKTYDSLDVGVNSFLFFVRFSWLNVAFSNIC